MLFLGGYIFLSFLEPRWSLIKDSLNTINISQLVLCLCTWLDSNIYLGCSWLSPPGLLPTPCLLDGDGKEILDSVQALSSCSRSISITSTVLVTNPKHISIGAAMLQVSSVPARPSILGNVAWCFPFNIQ